jgi:hypothetical protein
MVSMSLYLVGLLLLIVLAIGTGVWFFVIRKKQQPQDQQPQEQKQQQQQRTPTGTGREDLGPQVPGFESVPVVYDPTARVTFKNDGTKTCLATDGGNNDALVSSELCNNASDVRQRWTYDISKQQLRNVQGICLQAGAGTSREVIGWSCHEDAPAQKWAYSIQDKTLKNGGSGRCLGLKDGDGSGVGLADCSASTSTQKWTVFK